MSTDEEIPAVSGTQDPPVPLAGQEEFPFALIQGEPMTELPRDLYIPPDALEVFLETFEGPLDVLLYMIKRQNLDILNIPIAEITRQYTLYIEVMQELRLELAAEYLLMAAMLAEIKSRMLLPRPVEEGDEEDPRAELIRRLQEYERFKTAAEEMEQLPRMERDTYPVSAELVERKVVERLPDVTLKEMLVAFYDVMQRANMYATHHVQMEALSVRQRMSDLLAAVSEGGFREFSSLFDPREGRMGVVVTFLAILELVREMLLDVVQNEPYGPIHIQTAASERAAAMDEADSEELEGSEDERGS
jgi:segregation and condensation protein A